MGVTTRYYYDGWRVLTEVEGGNSRDFMYGNYLDEVLMMIVDDGQNQTDHYYAHDHLFSVVALIDDEGNVVERYEYDAYGKQTIFEPDFSAERNISSYNNVIAFTGQRLDELNGGNLLIMYYKNRYYLVDLGRFIQNDPLGVNDGICVIEFTDSGVPHFPRKKNAIDQYRDGMSLYEYVKSNPIQHQDSLGMSAMHLSDLLFSDCGYGVFCGRIKAETLGEKIADFLGNYHCYLDTKPDKDREEVTKYSVYIDRSGGRTIMAGKYSGTPCKCAMCKPHIKDCVEAAQKYTNYTPYGRNCHTYAAIALSKCCFKTKWKPAWHAGDSTCVRWKTIAVLGVHGGYAKICVERTPDFNE